MEKTPRGPVSIIRQMIGSFRSRRFSVHRYSIALIYGVLAQSAAGVNLLGGYSWEGGENLFDLSPSIVLPMLNQNQGPIAEAEVARKNARAVFLALQAGIIAQANGALMCYRGALEALNAADAALKFQANRLDRAQQAFAVGEDDRLMLAQAQLQRLAAEQTFLQALGNARSALEALEDSVEGSLAAAISDDIGSFSFPASIEKAAPMMDKRSRWIAAAVAVFILTVVLVRVVGRSL
jgi:outer membrane protein TolC